MQAFLARSGIGSRRKCEEIIASGRVSVNGSIITRMGYRVGPADKVRFDNKPIRPVQNKVYIALNKPPKYLCSTYDPENRPLVFDLLGKQLFPGLHTVGRLDYMSSGLIFLSNDGYFTQKVSHPSHNIEKEYILETKNPIPDDFLEKYQKGITLDTETYRLKDYKRKTSRLVYLCLLEGKNREIRRLCVYFRLKVARIHRIRIGIVKIDGIQAGKWRHMSQKEIHWFLK